MRRLQIRWVTIPEKDPPPKVPPVPQVIDSGMYLLEIEEIVERESRWQNVYLHLKCSVCHPAIHEDFRLHFVLSLTELSMWRMREFLEALWNEEMPEGSIRIDPNTWIGMKLYADVGIDQYRGQLRNQVKKFKPAFPLRGRDY